MTTKPFRKKTKENHIVEVVHDHTRATGAQVTQGKATNNQLQRENITIMKEVEIIVHAIGPCHLNMHMDVTDMKTEVTRRDIHMTPEEDVCQLHHDTRNMLPVIILIIITTNAIAVN